MPKKEEEKDKQVEKEKVVPQKAEEEEVVVDLNAKDEDKDDDKDEEKADRQERKRERYDKFLKESRDAMESAKAEAARAREEAQAVRLEMARLQGRVEAGPPGNRPDPYQEALEKNWQARQDLYDTVQSKQNITPEEHNAAKARFRQLEREAMELVSKKAAADFYREQQKNAPDPRQAMLKAQYADVVGTDQRPNPAGLNHFNAYYYHQRSQGRPANEPLIIESLEYARKMLAPQKPTAREQQRLAGSSVGGGDVGAHSDGIVKLGPRQRQMADATFKSIKDPQERYRKWAEKFSNIQKSKSA